MSVGFEQKTFWLGIDAGGTSTSVVLCDESGRLLGNGKSGTGHPIHDLSIVENNILDATNQALLQAGLPQGEYDQLIACGGYAGLHLTRFQNKISSWQHPFKKHYAVSDLEIAHHGALKGEDGALIILGTGFSALGCIGKTKKYIGGQGFLLGDIACGGWIGLQAVKYAIAFRDGMREHSQIVDAVEQHFNAQGPELADLMISATPNKFAEVTPLIFEAFTQGDKYAIALLNMAVEDAIKVLNAYIDFGVRQIVIHGSVGEALQPLLPQTYQHYIVKAQGNAEQGAVALAQAYWRNNRKVTL